jgi:predicted site-specific integrase-resolvase
LKAQHVVDITHFQWVQSKTAKIEMLIGYARVSTHDQTLNLQQDALEKIGCTNADICKTLHISRATLYRYVKTVGQKS